MDFVGLAKSLFSFLGGLVGIKSKEIDLHNAPDVKAAAAAQSAQDAQDKINKDVASGNLDEIKKDIAE